MQCNTYWLMCCSRRRKLCLTHAHPRVKREVSLAMAHAKNTNLGKKNMQNRRNLSPETECATDSQWSPTHSEKLTSVQDHTKNSGRCLRCGRKLKNPTALSLGYGPICYAKLQQEKLNRLF